MLYSPSLPARTESDVRSPLHRTSFDSPDPPQLQASTIALQLDTSLTSKRQSTQSIYSIASISTTKSTLRTQNAELVHILRGLSAQLQHHTSLLEDIHADLVPLKSRVTSLEARPQSFVRRPSQLKEDVKRKHQSAEEGSWFLSDRTRWSLYRPDSPTLSETVAEALAPRLEVEEEVGKTRPIELMPEVLERKDVSWLEGPGPSEVPELERDMSSSSSSSSGESTPLTTATVASAPVHIAAPAGKEEQVETAVVEDDSSDDVSTEAASEIGAKIYMGVPVLRTFEMKTRDSTGKGHRTILRIHRKKDLLTVSE